MHGGCFAVFHGRRAAFGVTFPPRQIEREWWNGSGLSTVPQRRPPFMSGASRVYSRQRQLTGCDM